MHRAHACGIPATADNGMIGLRRNRHCMSINLLMMEENGCDPALHGEYDVICLPNAVVSVKAIGDGC
jgi:hypothetical protein